MFVGGTLHNFFILKAFSEIDKITSKLGRFGADITASIQPKHLAVVCLWCSEIAPHPAPYLSNKTTTTTELQLLT